MKNTCTLLVLLSILCQSTLYSSDNNLSLQLAIEPSLQSALRVLKDTTTPVELDPILIALYNNVKTGAISKNVAIQKINGIKAAVEEYKSEKYPTIPEIVKNQIQPALNKINVTLEILTKWGAWDYIKLISKGCAYFTVISLASIFVILNTIPMGCCGGDDL